MYEERQAGASRRALIWVGVAVVNFALATAWTPNAHSQVSNFAPPARKGNATISVRELQVPSEARKEFERGLRRLEKRDPAGSLHHFDAAVRNYPSYYEVYYHQGIAEMKLDRPEEAAHAFQKAIDLSEGRYAQAEFGYALVLFRLGKPEEAERIVRHGLQNGPDIPDGYVVLGLVLLGLNRTDEAERSAREALRLSHPSAGKGYLVLADIHAARGEYENQVQDLDDYLKTYPHDPNKTFLKSARDVAKRLATMRSAEHEEHAATR
jgi:tetratricopeptide (TPR) repeat protein